MHKWFMPVALVFALVLILCVAAHAADPPEYADARSNPTLILTWASPGLDHPHHCTGFYIGQGKIVTAGHCIFDDEEKQFHNATYSVMDRNAKELGFTREVLFLDTKHDIAVLQAPAKASDATVRPAKVLCSPPSQGTIIRVTGYPLDDWYTETFGVVTSGVMRGDDPVWLTYVLNSARIDHGNSGGPAWDAEDNAVVGIAVGTVSWNTVMVPTSVLCEEYLRPLEPEKPGS